MVKNKNIVNRILFCVILLFIFFYHACSNVIQEAVMNKSSSIIKYSHVQTEKMFFEEVQEQLQFLSKKETFAIALHNLFLLQKANENFTLPNMQITFTCPFNKQHTVELLQVLQTRKYPCDMEQAGYIMSLHLKTPYKDFYGSKFADIENREQFLLRYTKDFADITTMQELNARINELYMNLSYKSNAIYDLQELKHYALNAKLVHSYQDFYALLQNYSVKCRGSFSKTTLDKVLMKPQRMCKKI